MNKYDHYVEAQELIGMLRKEGLSNYADAMLKAMEESSTGTEIFMALRWSVRNLIESEQCSDMTEIKARQLYEELDKALQ